MAFSAASWLLPFIGSNRAVVSYQEGYRFWDVKETWNFVANGALIHLEREGNIHDKIRLEEDELYGVEELILESCDKLIRLSPVTDWMLIGELCERDNNEWKVIGYIKVFLGN